MKIGQWIWAALLALMLGACGGGGSDAGTSIYDGGTSTGTDSSTEGSSSSTASYVVTVALQRSGAEINSITSTESVQAVATVKNSSGAAVEGVVVTFSQSGSLLTLAPSSGTALTGSDGKASIDISAASTSTAGATTVTASAAVGSTTYSGSKSLQITTSATTVATPSAINFVSVSPSTRAIVIKGAGGNGRSESATLTFQVVDANNAPIKGATVNFSVNPANSVTLNVTSAVSNASGNVTTTLQSGAVATSVVVTATAQANSAASAPSDTLIVSNGVAVDGAFEVVATKYNLDGLFTGHETTVSAFARDAFGNPVADGTAISFTTDFGAVGTSTLGGCTTLNGRCSVKFWVQDPRGTGLATVIGTVRVGVSSILSESININMAGATGGVYLATDSDGNSVTTLNMASCKQAFEFLLLDSDTGRSVAAGSTIAAGGSASGFTVSVTDGGTVLDSLSFAPTGFVAEVEVSDDVAVTGCSTAGTGRGSGFITLRYTTPNSIVFSQRFVVTYPK
jgi:hypothetical protein